MLVQGVPDIGASRELVRLFEVYGDIEEHKILENYPTEQFQEVHFIKYKKIQYARYGVLIFLGLNKNKMYRLILVIFLTS